MEKRAKPIGGLIGDPTGCEIAFTAPTDAGPYRLFVEIVDGQGNVAYGNIPFLVE